MLMGEKQPLAHAHTHSHTPGHWDCVNLSLACILILKNAFGCNTLIPFSG